MWEVILMFHCNCGCRISCRTLAAIAGVILGVLAAFAQISGAFVLNAIFPGVALVGAVAYLGLLPLSAGACRAERCCRNLTTVLVGILGTVLLAAILLAVGIVATSVLNAIAVGALVFFITLTLVGTACYAACLSDCEPNE